ncbi:hypothetical protein BDN70DRAFT_254416 [Pholiota conissans]|uniref:DUF6534 domain-containing protein n=1 Tax=Pholiota conissans TaxID=109636 RepID=A0A9P5YWS3_9AGAR|nr:hypothetical protein BDN70DRAFT_254416 [Pholiota conissans]
MSIFGIHLDLNPSYGVYLIGTFISNILLGATCVQTYLYFRAFKDTLLIKSTVFVLLILELMHGASSMGSLYHYLIGKFLDPLALTTTIWPINITFTITGSIVLVVHVFYAVRIYYVSGKQLPIPVFIAALSLGNFALGLVLTVKLFQNPFVVNLRGIRDNLAKAIFISAAIDDFLIAATLTYYLNRARTGIKQTDKIIDKLMIYAINNGILTSITGIVALAFVFAFPNDLYSVAIAQIIGNLYSNSLMATLNSRNKTKESAPSSLEIASHGLSTFGTSTNPQMPSVRAGQSFVAFDKPPQPKIGGRTRIQMLRASDEESL